MSEDTDSEDEEENCSKNEECKNQEKIDFVMNI